MNHAQKRIVRRIGRRLKMARIAADVAPVALADRLGIEIAQLIRCESGTEPIDADIIVAVAGILDLPLWFFFGRIGEE